MDLAAQSDASLVDSILAMAGWQDGARVVRDRGVLVIVGKSRFPTPYSNAALCISEEATPELLLDVAARELSDRRYFVWGNGADGGDLGRLALRHGFLPSGHAPAMVIERPPEPSRAPGITVEPVKTAAQFEAFVEVSSRAWVEYGLPDPVLRTLLARADRVIRSCASVAVARIDGRAVAAALSILSPGSKLGGVYWVGTVPEARRRGAADAVTRFVTRAAFRSGASIVALEASRAGEPVYLKMGYREVGRYARFLSPPP
jgi:ribosomal protein S18 acetylase RimI-like enzyme